MNKFSRKKSLLIMAAMLAGTMAFGASDSVSAATLAKTVASASQMKNSSVSELSEDTRVFRLDKSIQVKNVRFQNRYGFEVAEHLYLPKDFDVKKQYPAVVVTLRQCVRKNQGTEGGNRGSGRYPCGSLRSNGQDPL